MGACVAILAGIHDPFPPKVAVAKEESVPTITMSGAGAAAPSAAAAGGATRPAVVLPPPRGGVPVGGIGGMGARPYAAAPAAKPEIEEAEDEFDDDE